MQNASGSLSVTLRYNKDIVAAAHNHVLQGPRRHCPESTVRWKHRGGGGSATAQSCFLPTTWCAEEHGHTVIMLDRLLRLSLMHMHTVQHVQVCSLVCSHMPACRYDIMAAGRYLEKITTQHPADVHQVPNPTTSTPCGRSCSVLLQLSI
jgi:hypothetical protein